MKLNKKNRTSFLILILLGFLIGTLSWELLERVLITFNVTLKWEIGPVGFDLRVLSFYIKFNPGSVLGIIAGLFLFAAI